MQISRATTISSLIVATMSVYVCLLAADAQSLAQKSSVTVAARSYLRINAQPARKASTVTAQPARPAAEIALRSVRLSSQDEEIVANDPMPCETFCALLSKYLSLS